MFFASQKSRAAGALPLHPTHCLEIMATYHCSVKVGGKGRGAAHAAYISREGPHTGREGLEHREHGNMPAWAQADPLEFWRAADTYERANGAVYREIEVALPRELTPTQRRDLMHGFIQTHLGERHAYTLAIHNPTAALDGGEQPHAHLMFSERVRDGQDRDPAQYFRRYNAKAPERGGCRKDSMGTRERLQDFRQSWAELTNQALARYGHSVRVDHRSYRDRGIEREPEKHLGPVDAQRLSRLDRDALQAHRQAQRDLAHEQQALSRLNVGARLQRLTQERETHERQARQARAERERIERMTAKELAAEIQRLTPRPVEEVLQEREQAPIWTRIAELERLRQAKTVQEQAQEPLQAVQKPLETALERRQAAPPPQPLPTPTLESTAAQKPLQTAPERRQAVPPPQAAPDRQASPQAVQERPLTALEQEKARQLRDAFDRLDKRTALERFPELMRLYVLVAETARFAKEKMLDPQNRADFVEDIKERGIRELAQGKTLPKPAIQPEHKIEHKRERGYSPRR